MPRQEQSPTAPGPVSKPPLSPDGRRAKKREMDRMNQQRKRQRDREYLQQLQENVQLLQQDKASSLASRLMMQRDRDDQRLRRHRTRMLQIKGLINADLADLGQPEDGPRDDKSDTNALDPSLNSTVSPTVDSSLLLEATSPEPGPDSTFCPPAEKNDSLDALLAELSTPYDGEDDAVFWPPPILDAQAGAVESNSLPSSKPPLAARRSKTWRDIEQLISRTTAQSSASTIVGDTELDMHIIITAAAQGWTQFSQAVMVDARWSCLRELDEKYFAPNYSNVERLAVLTIASQTIGQDMMQQQTTTTTTTMGTCSSNILPPFIKPRPSQLAFPHSVIADCYVWPGFRERLSICHDYYTDVFLHATHTMFRFLWPYDFQDAFRSSSLTGLRHLSPRFLASMQDIRCWTMNSDFFQRWPDFRGDVPVSNPRPAPQPGLHTLWHAFQGRDETEADQDAASDETCFGVWVGGV
ncbi:hypothetical protein AYL99_05916 [Fonsecaea erecta]|uniref:BZIP domain-containing protein n=1 Tax=Fonsecaea erecta TaxID=1367422 RepID=A0A178ZM74_9EURO|nr:hypothetical protein AYL99_05916 [Fonsecaea erecta]OAP60914.1 hypothetical protein AYL99_05916 [Fonsecaea erecta]